MTEVENYNAEFIELDDSLLVPCENCHRTFREDIVEKHARVCERVWSRNITPQKKSDPIKLPVSESELRSKRNNWRIRHRHLQAAIMSAKSYVKEQAEKKSVEIADTPKAIFGGDIVNLITCPTCQRRYNESTAKRHFDYCLKRKERLDHLKKTIKSKEKPKKETSRQPESVKPGIPSPQIKDMAKGEMSESSAASETPTAVPTNGTSVTSDSIVMLMNQMSKMVSQMSQPSTSTISSPLTTKSPIRSPPESPISWTRTTSSPSSPVLRIIPKPLSHLRIEPSKLNPCAPSTQLKEVNQQEQQVLQQYAYPFYNQMQPPAQLHALLPNMQQSCSAWNSYPPMQFQHEAPSVLDKQQSAVAKFCCSCGSAFSSDMDKFCARCGARRILMRPS